MKPRFMLPKTDRERMFIFLGMFYIFLDYVLFDFSMYYSPLGLLAFIATFAIGVVFLLIPSYARSVGMSSGYLRRLSLAIIPLSQIPVIIMMLFDLRYNRSVYFLLTPFAPMIFAALIPVLAIFLVEKKTQITRRHGTHLTLLLAIFLISALTFYAVNSVLHAIGWAGTDEMAFDLYAARLFYNGANPYAFSMQPALAEFHLQQTSLINGSCFCSYTYPALGFLPLVFIPILGIGDLNAIVYLTILCCTFAALVLYRKSKRSYAVLSLMFYFFVFTLISRPGGAIRYLAVSVFLLLAYLERKKPYAQGAFLGLAAATHQLAWFALPFFYLLDLNELGKQETYRVIGSSAGVFLLANAYFIALSPGITIGQMFYWLGNKMQFQGASIVGALLAAGAGTDQIYLYSSAVIVIFYLLLMFLFYFYQKTLKPLIAIAPWAVFAFSPFNGTGYFLPFVPLIIAVYYVDKGKVEDKAKERGYIAPAVLLFAMIATLLMLLTV